MPKTPAADKKTVKAPRKIDPGSYKSFTLQKKIKTGDTQLPGSFKLLKGALGIMRRNWKVFLGIILIYGFFNLVLVQSFAGGDLDRTKNLLEASSENSSWGAFASGMMLFVYMAASSGNVNSDVAGAYQLILTVTTSLALIWALRQVYAEKKIRIRDAFYRGMYPLIPFILVLFVATLHLIPVVIGGFLYNLVSSSGIAVSGIEGVLWGTIFFLLGLVTLYLLSSALMALYIVCLPEMTPMTALKSARELVRFRRWAIMRRIIFLPIFLLVGAMLVILPMIFISPPLAGFFFFLSSMAGLPIIHSYIYRLYRELL
jgi:hypothetical protein